ncbi:MAG: hypothetical protein HQL37_06855 [Alphaproteobacteria bacterium]|nr:hypothetical protein [Alphaproteobacteria bacterium]
MYICIYHQPISTLDLTCVLTLLVTAVGLQRLRYLAIAIHPSPMSSPIVQCGANDMIVISRLDTGTTKRARSVAGDPTVLLFHWCGWQKSRARLERGRLSLTEPTCQRRVILGQYRQ